MIVRRKHNSGYTIIPNKAFEDERLSIAARGLLAYLLVKPDDWIVHINDIRKRCNLGRNKAYDLLHELIGFGYIRKRETRAPSGQMVKVFYTVYDEPEQPLPENREVIKKVSQIEPLPENQDLVNGDTYQLNTSTNSVPNGTGSVSNETGNSDPDGSGSAEPTITKKIWDLGVGLLTKHYPEKTNKEIRGIVGEWVQQAIDAPAELLKILQYTDRQGTHKPHPYIKKAVDKKFGPPAEKPDPKTFSPQKWRAIGQMALRDDDWPRVFGKPPGHKGCLMPPGLQTPELLSRFGPKQRALL